MNVAIKLDKDMVQKKATSLIPRLVNAYMDSAYSEGWTNKRGTVYHLNEKHAITKEVLKQLAKEVPAVKLDKIVAAKVKRVVRDLLYSSEITNMVKVALKDRIEKAMQAYVEGMTQEDIDKLARKMVLKKLSS